MKIIFFLIVVFISCNIKKSSFSIKNSVTPAKIIPISYKNKPRVMKTGETLPYFKLQAVNGKVYTNKDFNKKVLAIIFLSNHCPTAQAYEKRIIKLYNKYKDLVDFVLVTSNSPKALNPDELRYTDYGDTIQDTLARSKEIGLKIPYLYDADKQYLATALGALTTPHIFIFDEKRELYYNGAIDNAPNHHRNKITKPKKLYAENAINSILKNKVLDVRETRPTGCSTKWLYKAKIVEQKEKKFLQKKVHLKTIVLKNLANFMNKEDGRYKVFKFWATWCQSCIEDFPIYREIMRQYDGRNIDFYTISLDEEVAHQKVLEVLNEENMALPHRFAKRLKKRGEITNNYRLTISDIETIAKKIDPKWRGPIPYMIITDPKGKIVYRHEGSFDKPIAIKKEIIKLIGRLF